MDKSITYLDFNNPILQKDQYKTLNLGALYIIASLENNGYEVEYRDYQISEFGRSLKIKDMVKFADGSGDIILICCMAYMLPLIMIMIKKIKANYPEKTIILGGIGPTGVAEELMKSFENVDIIIKGEGEQSIIEVIKALNNPKDAQFSSLKRVKGIIYRNQYGEIIVNSPRMRIKDLDGISFPAYHVVNMNKYQRFGIITGRGCAYKCKFCDIHGLWGNKYFKRSMDNVFDELEILVGKYGINHIEIFDDTFTMTEERVMSFCNHMKERDLSFDWNCFGRVNLVNERLIENMAKSKCKGIFYGLESGSERILQLIDKRITVDMIVRGIEMTIPYMPAKGHFLWGFPFETYSDLYQSVYLYNYLKDKAIVTMGQLWPYPTSPLYEEYKNTLRFNPNISSFSMILPFKEDEEFERKQVIELIENHKEIFTQFYYYQTDDFDEKYRMMQNFDELNYFMNS